MKTARRRECAGKRRGAAHGLCFASVITLLALFTPVRGAQAAPIYPESGGQVVMEAEDFSARSAPVDLPEGLIVDSDPDQWLIVTSEYAGSEAFSNARGEFLQVSDANGVNGEGNFSDPTGLGPFVDYVVRISTVGDYELFARADSPGTNNNSFWCMVLDPLGGLVDDFGFGVDTDQDFATTPWEDRNAIFSIASAGDYTVRLAPREDGVAVDTLVFQRTSLPVPTGNGPPATLPIPEPDTLLLVSLGLLGLAVLGRRPGCPRLGPHGRI